MSASAGLFWDFIKVAVAVLIIAMAVIVALLSIRGPYRPAEEVTGRIVSIGVSDGRSIRPVAMVQVDGRLIKVDVQLSTRCWTGSDVSLLRKQTEIGFSYSLALRPDACRPAPGDRQATTPRM